MPKRRRGPGLRGTASASVSPTQPGSSCAHAAVDRARPTRSTTASTRTVMRVAIGTSMGAFKEEDQELAPERVAELLRERKVQLVDVREGYEHGAGRIPGDHHIVMDRLATEANTLDREVPVVFYCRTGSRSAIAAEA